MTIREETEWLETLEGNANILVGTSKEKIIDRIKGRHFISWPFENLYGDGSEEYPLGWLFNEAIDCSSKSMYPDYLSLTGEGYIPSMYKKYGQVVSLMGKCKLAHVKPIEPLLNGCAA